MFLAGCGLPQAWRGRASFAIGELGFGTGLNALAVWDLWRQERPPSAVLHFVSIEGFPLEREEAARALAPFDEIAPLRARLLARWPLRVRGAQRLWFEDDGFALTVLHAPVEEALAGLTHTFDAWFLDGFAPARNTPMWSEATLARVAALSAPGARLATYTVAGAVRRGLAAQGLSVEKRVGFAGKRERLEAQAPGAAINAPRPNTIAVIGAGIAGASVAAALIRRGVACTVHDPAPASAASGNPVGIVSPRLDRGDTGAARFFLAAYAFACDAYGDLLKPVGVEHRPRDDRERAALADLNADPPLPATHRTPLQDGALFPLAGTVRPRDLVGAFLAGADVRATTVTGLERAGARWRLRGAKSEADVVVLACGAALGAFAPALPLQFTRGQMEWGPVAGAPSRAIEAGPYVAPHEDGVAFGATFDRLAAPDAVHVDADSRARNLAALATLNVALAARVDPARLQSRAAVRAATPDRVPVAGRLDDGLYVIGALGSRGLSTAPLLGEVIASAILGEPAPLDAAALRAIDPARLAR